MKVETYLRGTSVIHISKDGTSERALCGALGYWQQAGNTADVPDSSPTCKRCIKIAPVAVVDIALVEREEAAQTLASLPVIDGYRWQWFNPQGGLPESRTVIQLMYADDRTLSPAAILHKNGDGTWYATRGGAWSYSGYIGTFIAGRYQTAFTMLQCAALVAVEADERGMLAAWARLQDEAKLAADANTQMQKEHREKVCAERPATVGKLCKIKQSSAGHRAKWRRGGQR